jgi:hypothetical protein
LEARGVRRLSDNASGLSGRNLVERCEARHCRVGGRLMTTWRAT